MSQTPQTLLPGFRRHPPALGYQRRLSDKPHRVSSQSTRVNQNGSTMPSLHALNERVADTQGYTKEDEQDASYAERGDLMNDPTS